MNVLIKLLVDEWCVLTIQLGDPNMDKKCSKRAEDTLTLKLLHRLWGRRDAGKGRGSRAPLPWAPKGRPSSATPL